MPSTQAPVETKHAPGGVQTMGLSFTHALLWHAVPRKQVEGPASQVWFAQSGSEQSVRRSRSSSTALAQKTSPPSAQLLSDRQTPLTLQIWPTPAS